MHLRPLYQLPQDMWLGWAKPREDTPQADSMAHKRPLSPGLGKGDRFILCKSQLTLSSMCKTDGGETPQVAASASACWVCGGSGGIFHVAPRQSPVICQVGGTRAPAEGSSWHRQAEGQGGSLPHWCSGQVTLEHPLPWTQRHPRRHRAHTQAPRLACGNPGEKGRGWGPSGSIKPQGPGARVVAEDLRAKWPCPMPLSNLGAQNARQVGVWQRESPQSQGRPRFQHQHCFPQETQSVQRD